MNDKDTEFTLAFDNQTAVVSPFGASLRSYSVDGWNAVWSYRGGANKKGGQGDVLIPFPGRVRGGEYEFEGTRHALVKNDKDGPNAIHGFLRAELFETLRQTPASAAFAYKLGERPGYPFNLTVEIAYSLGEEGLETLYKITNTGRTPAPVGAGFHPYFCGDVGELADWIVTIPADEYLETENVVPTGRVLPVDNTIFDFRGGRVVGDTKYNGCVRKLKRDADGWATASVHAPSSSRRVSVKMDSSFDYVVIYTGDTIPSPYSRRAFAIEPMTCGPDAFNHAGWGTRVLAPGESMSGRYVIKGES